MHKKESSGKTSHADVAGSSYARVAVPLPLRSHYHYRIGTRLLPLVKPGVRVVVEFAGRRLLGFVLGLDRSPEVEEGKVKEVVEAVDPVPCLSPELLSLAEWIAGYYHHPIGEVLYTLLPPAVRTGDRVSYSPMTSGPLPEALPAEAARILGLVSEKGRLGPLSLPVGSGPATESLIQMGLLGVERRESAAPSGKPLRTVTLSPEAPTSGQIGPKGKKLAELLRVLADGPHSTGELQALEIGPDTLKRAEAKGWVLVAESHAPPLEGGEYGFGAEGENEPTEAQLLCLEKIGGALDAGTFSPFLLMGVTGSGKTEVYLRAVSDALKRGLGALVLVPEIGLTPQLLGRFATRLGERMAVLHSGLTDRERGKQWEAARSGVARVVVGTRSAVYAPIPNLGLIVVDEEHEGSYKQEEGLRYNAKHVALVRAKKMGATVVLGSATPDLETYRHAQKGRYGFLRLPGRVAGAEKPRMRLVDLRPEEARRGRRVLVSEDLKRAVDGCLGRGEQALIFINRRGFSPALYCGSCGESVQCSHCSVPMTLHRRGHAPTLVCHYCGIVRRPPSVCPSCAGEGLIELGAGTQRIEDAVASHWPEARILRLDRDTAASGDVRGMLSDFAAGGADVLVGTQMVAKGHHFPRLTVVGVVSADDGLHVPDFRAAERTFQMITQVAGRAGRSADMPGEVLVQTRNPLHPVMKAAIQGDYEDFAARELRERRDAGFPPFARLALVRISALSPKEALEGAREVFEALRGLTPVEGLDLLGPAPAPIEKIKGRYRHQILIRSRSMNGAALQGYLKDFAAVVPKKRGADLRVSLDVDPVTLT